MAVPVPEDMDGKELLCLFKDDFVDKHPPQRQRIIRARDREGLEEGYSKEEEEKMRERLRGLGYVE